MKSIFLNSIICDEEIVFCIVIMNMVLTIETLQIIILEDYFIIAQYLINEQYSRY